MTQQEFLYNIPRFIFKEIAKTTNQLCGQSKTSTLITQLFATLPIKVELRRLLNQPKPSKKLNVLEEYIHCYIKHDDSTTVYLAFYYSEDKHINRIAKAVEKHPEFFTYLYMREALKLTRLMNTKTHYQMMSSLIHQNNPTILRSEHYRYSIKACNYVVNSTIAELFTSAGIGGKFSRIIESQPYYTSYKGMHETQVLLDLIKSDAELPAPEPMDEQVSFDPFLGEPGMTDGELPEEDYIITDTGYSVQAALGSMSRGSSTSEAIFGEFFTAKKVKTGWFKRLVAKFEADVYHMTNTFRAEWSNLNITYRHKFKSPKPQYIDNKLAVVLSVDHSGSVSTDGLQKLLYLFEKHAKRITKLIVLVHDTGIVKEFVLESDYDISSNPNFKQALSHRFAVGGTSHLTTFKRIAELIQSKEVDPSKCIYISFSDNCSDIPESWKAVPQMAQLSTTFLAPYDNPVNIPGTIDISMQ